MRFIKAGWVSRAFSGRLRVVILPWILFLAVRGSAHAEMQSDIFWGYGGTVREAAWFPVACEIFNDGPSLDAFIEVSSGSVSSDQVRRVPIELPTNTRKRLVIPMFAAGSRFAQWEVRLLNGEGKVHREWTGMQPRTLGAEAYLLGAIPSAFAGLPAFPDVNVDGRQPAVARLQVEQFPENPIALEGLDALYVNSESALDFTSPQVDALLLWVRSGGRLIISVEQLTDVNATPWLRELLPVRFTDVAPRDVTADLRAWLERDPPNPGSSGRSRPGGMNPFRNLERDSNFTASPVPVAMAEVVDGKVLCSSENLPLIVDAERGRGRVTVLAFNPEREPFRSWGNRDWFWARVAELPPEMLSGRRPSTSQNAFSIDGVFGSLLDTRQVRRLPVKWLLLLLVAYLVVIGPFDQYWLKRINRQMLTWVTFPAYVVLFSLLIFFIGYKLRAGDTEWNELNLVDIVPNESSVDLRGQTYISLYSSSNARYPISGQSTFATLRGELLEYGGARGGGDAVVQQDGHQFRAEVFVPVWTSSLYVSDWLAEGDPPLQLAVTEDGSAWRVQVQSMVSRTLTDLRLVIGDRLFQLDDLAPQERKQVRLQRHEGEDLLRFVQQHHGRLERAVQARRTALGSDQRSRLDDPALTATLASFGAHLNSDDSRQFVIPEAMNLSPCLERGDAVLLALDRGQTPIEPLNGFDPPRMSRSTLFRLAVPVAGR